MNAHEWNGSHSVGTPVLVRSAPGRFFVSKTRSEAWDVSSGDSLVLVDGKTGGYWLDAMTPVRDGESEAAAHARIDTQMDRSK